MKAILMSIQPKWCELIASGKKTIELRKTAPKEVPFKVYIYQTKKRWIYKILPWLKEKQTKIIGEFICDSVEEYEANDRGWYIYPQDEVYMWTDEIAGYGNGKTLYGLHISKLKIYNEPKELMEFVKPCNWHYDCCTCKRAIYELTKAEARLFYGCDREHTHPPQSWCYVEDTIYE